MKLTAKNVMFILMSVLLVLTVFLTLVTLSQVMDFLKPGGNANANVPQDNNPGGNSIAGVPTIPSQSTQGIPGHEHEYTVKGTVHSPKCDTLGYTEYYCECGEMDFQDFQSALGHKYGEYSVVAATCTTDGWTERKCTRCNIIEKTNIVTAAHNYSEWISDSDTTEQRTCYLCDVIEIRSADTANTWVLRLTELEAPDGFVHYKIVVDLADNENDPAYDIYTELAETLRFDYASNMLLIGYAPETIYFMPADAAIVTFYADGTITNAEPEVTDEPNPDIGNEDTGNEETGSDELIPE